MSAMLSLAYNGCMQTKHVVGAVWSIIGITVIVGGAIVRVWPRTVEAIAVGLDPLQWTVLVLWVTFMLIGEGYRGFQRQFSPRFAARMWSLLQHGRTVDLWLAPFYCIGYYRTTRRRMLSSWSLTIGVTLIILVVAHIAQPWRGIIDTGVLLGLSYGLISIYVFAWQTLQRRTYATDPEVTKPSI